MRGEGLEFYIPDSGRTEEIRVCHNRRFLGRIVKESLYDIGRYPKPWVMDHSLRSFVGLPESHQGFDSEYQAIWSVKRNIKY